MVDFAGVSPLGSGVFNTRPSHIPAAPAVPAVESSGAGQGLSGRMSSNNSHADSGAGQRQAAESKTPAYQPKAIDSHTVPGPPPSFEVSLLELDRDLAQSLARMNATHAIASDAAAISESPREGTPDAAETAVAPEADSAAAEGAERIATGASTEPYGGYSAA